MSERGVGRDKRKVTPIRVRKLKRSEMVYSSRDELAHVTSRYLAATSPAPGTRMRHTRARSDPGHTEGVDYRDEFHFQATEASDTWRFFRLKRFLEARGVDRSPTASRARMMGQIGVVVDSRVDYGVVFGVLSDPATLEWYPSEKHVNVIPVAAVIVGLFVTPHCALDGQRTDPVDLAAEHLEHSDLSCETPDRCSLRRLAVPL
jgi:hypothetical protein